MYRMGDVIRLDDRRVRRRPDATALGSVTSGVRAEFFFDLASPFTYLAAERVERAFDVVTWTPACARTLRCRAVPGAEGDAEGIVAQARERAAALRLPLEWPERWPAPAPAAMRMAHPAEPAGGGGGFVLGAAPPGVSRGVVPPGGGGCGAFVLAATRLAFAGGFDLDDVEILTEAAAAAGLPLDDALRAAREPRRDGAMEAAARRLLSAGADRLPALHIERGVFWGVDRVSDAVATARLHAAAAGR